MKRNLLLLTKTGKFLNAESLILQLTFSQKLEQLTFPFIGFQFGIFRYIFSPSIFSFGRHHAAITLSINELAETRRLSNVRSHIMFQTRLSTISA